MAGRERTLITLLVGHDSELLKEPNANGHIFRWTVFVRPLSPHRFVDRSFISKVKFTLHNSYEVPIRTVKHPPFEVSETGYGSFPPQLEIHFNYPGAKPIKYTYDMLVTLDRKGHTEQEVRFELKDCPPSFAELASKYGPKRKKSSEDNNKREMKMDTLFPPSKILKLDEDRSSRESSKDPKKKKEKKDKEVVKEKTKEEKEEKEKRRKEKERRKEEKSEKKREKTKSPVETEKKAEKVVELVKASTSSQPVPSMPVTPNRPVKTAPNKTAEEKKAPLETDSSSPSTCGSLTPPPKKHPVLTTKEMQRRIAALTNEDQIYRVAEVLMSHPSSCLQPSKTALSFDLDLSTADPSLVSRLQDALSS